MMTVYWIGLTLIGVAFVLSTLGWVIPTLDRAVKESKFYLAIGPMSLLLVLICAFVLLTTAGPYTHSTVHLVTPTEVNQKAVEAVEADKHIEVRTRSQIIEDRESRKSEERTEAEKLEEFRKNIGVNQ